MKAIILAAGRGTRMQREVAGARLDEAQRQQAERGLKGLIPIGGRPFLDHVIAALADGGVRDVCIVIAPGPNPVREHYAHLETNRVNISFAVQSAPLGGAHALLAAESFAGDDAVIVINSDNYYPPAAVRALRIDDCSALAGFTRDVLVTRGNVRAERLAGYALVRTDGQGYMTAILEKPGAEVMARAHAEPNCWISMTCWRFRPVIFRACRAIVPSARGEFELPDAVMCALRTMHEPFRVVPVHEPVLDMTSRDDIASVEQLLHGHEVRL